MPRSNTITKHKSCLFCHWNLWGQTYLLPVLWSTRRPDSAAAHLLLSWPVRWKKPRETQREKSKINMDNIAIIAHFPLVGFNKWVVDIEGLSCWASSWWEMPLFDCKSLQKWVTMEGMQKEGLGCIVKKARELAHHQVLLDWTRQTRCRTTPLRMLALEEFTVGGSLSGQSHFQKLQRCALKWVLAPSLQPSTCSTNRDNYNIKPPDF